MTIIYKIFILCVHINCSNQFLQLSNQTNIASSNNIGFGNFENFYPIQDINGKKDFIQNEHSYIFEAINNNKMDSSKYKNTKSNYSVNSETHDNKSENLDENAEQTKLDIIKNKQPHDNIKNSMPKGIFTTTFNKLIMLKDKLVNSKIDINPYNFLKKNKIQSSNQKESTYDIPSNNSKIKYVYGNNIENDSFDSKNPNHVILEKNNLVDIDNIENENTIKKSIKNDIIDVNKNYRNGNRYIENTKSESNDKNKDHLKLENFMVKNLESLKNAKLKPDFFNTDSKTNVENIEEKNSPILSVKSTINLDDNIEEIFTEIKNDNVISEQDSYILNHSEPKKRNRRSTDKSKTKAGISNSFSNSEKSALNKTNGPFFNKLREENLLKKTSMEKEFILQPENEDPDQNQKIEAQNEDYDSLISNDKSNTEGLFKDNLDEDYLYEDDMNEDELNSDESNSDDFIEDIEEDNSNEDEYDIKRLEHNEEETNEIDNKNFFSYFEPIEKLGKKLDDKKEINLMHKDTQKYAKKYQEKIKLIQKMDSVKNTEQIPTTNNNLDQIDLTNLHKKRIESKITNDVRTFNIFFEDVNNLENEPQTPILSVSGTKFNDNSNFLHDKSQSNNTQIDMIDINNKIFNQNNKNETTMPNSNDPSTTQTYIHTTTEFDNKTDVSSNFTSDPTFYKNDNDTINYFNFNNETLNTNQDTPDAKLNKTNSLNEQENEDTTFFTTLPTILTSNDTLDYDLNKTLITNLEKPLHNINDTFLLDNEEYKTNLTTVLPANFSSNDTLNVDENFLEEKNNTTPVTIIETSFTILNGTDIINDNDERNSTNLFSTTESTILHENSTVIFDENISDKENSTQVVNNISVTESTIKPSNNRVDQNTTLMTDILSTTETITLSSTTEIDAKNTTVSTTETTNKQTTIENENKQITIENENKKFLESPTETSKISSTNPSTTIENGKFNDDTFNTQKENGEMPKSENSNQNSEKQEIDNQPDNSNKNSDSNKKTLDAPPQSNNSGKGFFGGLVDILSTGISSVADTAGSVVGKVAGSAADSAINNLGKSADSVGKGLDIANKVFSSSSGNNLGSANNNNKPLNFNKQERMKEQRAKVENHHNRNKEILDSKGDILDKKKEFGDSKNYRNHPRQQINNNDKAIDSKKPIKKPDIPKKGEKTIVNKKILQNTDKKDKLKPGKKGPENVQKPTQNKKQTSSNFKNPIAFDELLKNFFDNPLIGGIIGALGLLFVIISCICCRR
ncbi:hypothetical protein GVAV_000595 [Gurleya vavrai]